MSFNGSGVFNRIYNFVNDAAAGIKIRADRMDAEIGGIATGLTSCITKDGQTTVTANLPMAGYRHTGVGDATARNHYVTLGQVSDNKNRYCTVGGTADVITFSSAVIAFSAYVAGMELSFISSGTNTGAVTVNVDGLGAKAITKNGTDALIAGDIPSGAYITIGYDGTRFQLLNVSYTISTYGRSLIDDADAAAARTTLGLGTAATTAATDYATAVQGAKADTALQSGSQAEIEAETSAKGLDGANAKYHPLVAKAWAEWNGATTGTNAPRAGNNVSTVQRTGTGLYTITFTTAMSNAYYSVSFSCVGSLRGCVVITSKSAGSFSIRVSDDSSATVFDSTSVSMMVFGDI